jgi:prepilin-type N-terminal cleavage/methylation domain-containing protein
MIVAQERFMASPFVAGRFGPFPRAGFTVPEMLAVVAIILIVLSILLPSLNKGREHAIRIQCQVNLKNLILATRGYVLENRHYLPFPNSNAIETSGAWTGPGWLYKAPNKTQLEHIEAGVLWPHLRDYKTYRCPLDKPPYLMGPVHNITSYGMNGELRDTAHLPAYRTFDLKVGRAIIFWETDETQGGGFWNDGNNFPNEGITRRHFTGATVAVIDGSTEWLNYSDYYALAGQDPGRLWCKP